MRLRLPSGPLDRRRRPKQSFVDLAAKVRPRTLSAMIERSPSSPGLPRRFGRELGAISRISLHDEVDALRAMAITRLRLAPQTVDMVAMAPRILRAVPDGVATPSEDEVKPNETWGDDPSATAFSTARPAIAG